MDAEDHLDNITKELSDIKESLRVISGALDNINLGGIAVYLNDGENGEINVNLGEEEE